MFREEQALGDTRHLGSDSCSGDAWWTCEFRENTACRVGGVQGEGAFRVAILRTVVFGDRRRNELQVGRFVGMEGQEAGPASLGCQAAQAARLGLA